MKLSSMMLGAVLAASVPQVAAAAVTYTFTGTHSDFAPNGTPLPDATAIFTVTLPTFITAARDVTPTACTAGGAFYTCSPTQRFEPFPTGFGPGVGGDFVGLNLTNVDMSGGGTAYYFFQPGAFGAPGTYTDVGYPNPGGGFGNAGLATLVVGGAPSGVPEASTWAMLIAGFGALGTALRRRRATAGISPGRGLLLPAVATSAG